MKKSITFIAIISIVTFLSFAFTNTTHTKTDSDVGISFFNGTWEEALAKAKAENKIIFLDSYASWCGPCKILSKRYFTKKNVGEFYNANFINFKMDMEKNPNGPRLNKKFKLRGYPTLYFVDSNENIVKQSVGLVDDKKLIAFGKEALAK